MKIMVIRKRIIGFPGLMVGLLIKTVSSVCVYGYGRKGWWKSWTPQVVVGSDDISSHSWGDTGGRFEVADNPSNAFNNRYYIAVTKHWNFDGWGELGTHFSYLYNRRSDYPLNGFAAGINFQFKLYGEDSLWKKAVNGLCIYVWCADDVTAHSGGNKSRFSEYDRFNFNSGNTDILEMYQLYYQTIKACNYVINNAERTPVEKSFLEPRLGQAYFLKSIK